MTQLPEQARPSQRCPRPPDPPEQKSAQSWRSHLLDLVEGEVVCRHARVVDSVKADNDRVLNAALHTTIELLRCQVGHAEKYADMDCDGCPNAMQVAYWRGRPHLVHGEDLASLVEPVRLWSQDLDLHHRFAGISGLPAVAQHRRRHACIQPQCSA